MDKDLILKLYGIRRPSERDLETAEYMVQYMAEYRIDTVRREAMYLAQVGHESGRLRYFEELASGKAYETRTDLGNSPEVDGDGPLYKGRGLIQVTGRNNYEECGKWLGEDLISHPELLCVPKYAVLSSVWYWDTRGLNAYADRRDLVGCTKVINGGLYGFDDRETLYITATNLLNQKRNV